MANVFVPARLATACAKAAQRAAWLAALPVSIDTLSHEWSLTLGTPFDGDDVSCAWVAPARCADGRRAILKLAMPHLEGEHEIQGLRFWQGDPTVRLFEADEALGAMLLERCEPGTPLRARPEPEQDVVLAGLLKRLWRVPPSSFPFRPLRTMIAAWSGETRDAERAWPDPALVREGLRVFEALSTDAVDGVLLATDLHAGNVLRARRGPWLAIDPKPFIGDRAYDVTQHLFNCQARLVRRPDETIDRLADLTGCDRNRVRLWTFARAAAEPRDEWQYDWRLPLARAMAP